MKYLIINADDFGLHENINIGIIAGHTKGCITSTSIMPGAPAFEHAAALAANHPRLGVGVHLTLVGGVPVSEPEKVSSLLNRDGLLCASYPAFLKKYCLAGIRLTEVRQELAAQVKRVVSAGIRITHLDSHQHMHIVPGVLEAVLDIAKEFDIPAMRIPAEPLLFFGGFRPTADRVIGRSGLSLLARLARNKAKQAGLLAPEHFFGMLAGGNMAEGLLLKIIDNLPEGLSEIMVHPGMNDVVLNTAFSWGYHWQQELAALTSPLVAERLKQHQIKLVSFANIHKK
ncbi:ChbG/HpnK family deacetylase [Sporomusa aerivorans]|uniref:ChbG/HpnK family deacetylase n=1 Tax=Sporomusa aerivorans TaxID=204936 RepID=UPI00352AC8AB